MANTNLKQIEVGRDKKELKEHGSEDFPFLVSYERLGDYVYGTDVECIEEAVLPMLREKGLRFAAAESCTGGEIAKRITDIPGASAVFLGGCVTYTNEAKARLLGIDPTLIEANGAVSEPVFCVPGSSFFGK